MVWWLPSTRESQYISLLEFQGQSDSLLFCGVILTFSAADPILSVLASFSQDVVAPFVKETHPHRTNTNMGKHFTALIGTTQTQVMHCIAVNIIEAY